MRHIDLSRLDLGSLTTRKQHYVWRFYLEAWANRDGKVLFARNGEIKPASNPINVMAERDFYKLPRIDAEDARFLNCLIRLSAGNRAAGSASQIREQYDICLPGA